MDWFALAGNFIKRVPIERVLFPPRDNAKSLEQFVTSVRSSESHEKAPPSPSSSNTTQTVESPPETTVQSVSQPSYGVSNEETLNYQKREICKLLYQMEMHYAQRLRIAGVPCDCGSSKHLLGIEAFSEETIPMVSDPEVYYRILEWVKEAGPKSTDEAAKSGLYDEDYPTLSRRARDFRKEIIGSLEPSALFPKKPGEPEGARILPVITEEEKKEIKEKAHQKIEEVFSNG